MLKELVLKNRSYRRFDASAAIGARPLIDLIDLARNCPSAANLQSLRYLPVWQKHDCDAVFPNLRWAGYLRYWDGPSPQERPTAYIFILCPCETTKFHHTDAGIAAQTMLLGATELGLGGCMIASMDRDALKSVLDLPQGMEICLTIALGKPAEQVVIEDVIDPDDIEYWRDDDSIHHVPKRSLNELIIIPIEEHIDD
jgi:hypothetical protein